MTLLQCGCEQDGSARCRQHFLWGCHNVEDDMCPNCVTPWKCNGPHLSELVCPPCRIAKWRSVSLSSAATPTRGKA